MSASANIRACPIVRPSPQHFCRGIICSLPGKATASLQNRRVWKPPTLQNRRLKIGGDLESAQKVQESANFALWPKTRRNCRAMINPFNFFRNKTATARRQSAAGLNAAKTRFGLTDAETAAILAEAVV